MEKDFFESLKQELTACGKSLSEVGRLRLIGIISRILGLGAGYILLIIVVIACRKPLFIHPFIRLMSKQLRSEEELALKIMEAEHQAELDYLHIENRVENATREVNFYIAFIGRAWSWLSTLFHKK